MLALSPASAGSGIFPDSFLGLTPQALRWRLLRRLICWLCRSGRYVRDRAHLHLFKLADTAVDLMKKYSKVEKVTTAKP